ncbi:glutaredoxin family protein [Micropruina sp.]|uniref:glutaredoxin family protein n=1 Tax=Micropruina sp. TaxID=2737536 RepID=UPI0039E22987
MPGPRVTIVVRDGCHLCDDAVALARRVCADLGAGLAVRDVDADPALAQHADHVPVTFVDDRRLAIWFLDEQQLRAALAG